MAGYVIANQTATTRFGYRNANARYFLRAEKLVELSLKRSEEYMNVGDLF